MKALNKILLGALVMVSLNTSAQTDKATTTKIVEGKSYTFVARNAMPMNASDIYNVLSQMPGGNASGGINLNSDQYRVKISADTVVAFLPYYGRSFSPPTNPTEGGIKFTSTKFDYKIIKGKKRGWDAEIKPTDTKESYRLSLNIGDEGYATLSVTSNNKQPITFYGILKEND